VGDQLQPGPQHALDVIEPIDATHRDCIIAMAWVRQTVREAKRRVARWEPRLPIPKDFQ
jgi:hypothetical protein